MQQQQINMIAAAAAAQQLHMTNGINGVALLRAASRANDNETAVDSLLAMSSAMKNRGHMTT